MKKRGAERRFECNRNAGIFLLLLFLLSGLVFVAAPAVADGGKARDPQYIFYKGNTLYEEGKYDAAVKEYSLLIEQGLESGHLYYNIGNSYFKKGELGMAILYYERAKRLVPGDSDLRSNYAYALSKIRQASPSPQVPWYKRLLSLFGVFTLDGLTIMLSVLFVSVLLATLSVSFFPYARKYSHIAIVVLLLLLLLAATTFYNRVSLIDSEAVMIVDSSDAKYEPLEKATTYFTLYEGSKIIVLQSRKEWSKIRRADGKIGWVKSQAIEII